MANTTIKLDNRNTLLEVGNGGFDGKNIETAKILQQVIAELESK